MSVSTIGVSYSPVKKLPAYNLKRFKTKRLESIDEFIKITLAQAWSPIVWKDGIRKSKNYLSMHFLALDYDSGVRIWDTMNYINSLNLQFFLMTTKSHQIAKVTRSGKVLPACDRYRVVIPIRDTASTNEEQFQWQMRKAFDDFPGCDRSCVDQARFYQPGVKLVAKNLIGAYYELKSPPAIEVFKSRERSYMQRNKHYSQNGVVPRWIQSMLVQRSGIGERNQTVYVVSRKLAALGFELNVIENVIFNSVIDLPTLELRRTIHNGAKKGYRDCAAYG